MRIMVVGVGKVGHTLAEQLCNENHDVTVVDTNEAVLERCQDQLDVLCVHGNGANAKTLLDAGVDRADIVIAATHGDETNMLCCLLANRLGAKYTIARIRDPEYNESLTLLKRETSIDMTINPERATALEISRLLRFPFASNIESFARGYVEMVEFVPNERDAITGHSLKDLAARMPGIPKVLYAAVARDGEVIIPNGDFVLRAGDRVQVVGTQVTITDYFRYLGRTSKRVRNVMMLGGGRVSYYLAKMITPMGMHVSMIEIDPEKAFRLSEQLPDVSVLCGDGTDQELLEQEGLQDMDAFIALSSRDEENLMTGVYAVRQGVAKVIVKNNHVSYGDILTGMGLDSIVSPRTITCDTILHYVRGRVNGGDTRIEKLYRLMGGKAEAIEFNARQEDACTGIPLKDLHVRSNSLVAVIVRKGKVIVPFGSDHIEPGDSVVIITCEKGIKDLNEVISK